MLFCCASLRRFREQHLDRHSLLIAQMTTKHLESLGWHSIDEGRQEDGRYCLLAMSCGHFVIAFADSRNDAWSAACSLAMKLTREDLRLPSRL